MADESQTWYLLKNEDGTVFGPVPFEQLKQWSVDAQISPLDRVSVDAQNWMRAPMLPELGMDYLVEVSPDQYYGPTTFGAIREFLQMGEINGDTHITNCKDGSITALRNIPELQVAQEDEEAAPVRTSIRFNLQQRIRELEEALMDERRSREEAEHHLSRLEAKLEEITKAASR
jgi:peptidoglycan hydrolase-like protein with peptidoglycan-binding domain